MSKGPRTAILRRDLSASANGRVHRASVSRVLSASALDGYFMPASAPEDEHTARASVVIVVRRGTTAITAVTGDDIIW